MPTYDYFCEANGRKVEVSHKMNEQISTWGELCERSRSELGDTPAASPVKRLISGAAIIGSSGSSKGELPPCASGGCAGGMCGF
ncbi:MAG: zinc ribbon domain-containing protein [Gammaproteobacteria bacterium]|nr:zinc ribbon domain-containing protein [Gammaproteobacteria bacterium]MCB1851200.1 zinc ribbon domain-containing protein [Gammaproteobacteria bacterium]MCP5418791.1 zinc ribbon domain-containing protein [Chromatiaceae bacterium]